VLETGDGNRGLAYESLEADAPSRVVVEASGER
jgi:hypothetical protein